MGFLSLTMGFGMEWRRWAEFLANERHIDIRMSILFWTRASRNAERVETFTTSDEKSVSRPRAEKYCNLVRDRETFIVKLVTMTVQKRNEFGWREEF
ncbi:hypothetical protein RB195_020121 [Necator americanus]|uniref:Uncharacterized protein n=1 Tax=Necator americanus TaxID=51031 RepID=A0ABR1CJP6_NECAM